MLYPGYSHSASGAYLRNTRLKAGIYPEWDYGQFCVDNPPPWMFLGDGRKRRIRGILQGHKENTQKEICWKICLTKLGLCNVFLLPSIHWCCNNYIQPRNMSNTVTDEEMKVKRILWVKTARLSNKDVIGNKPKREQNKQETNTTVLMSP